MKKGAIAYLFLGFAVFIGCFISGCEEEAEIPEMVSTDYFPMKVGTYIIYQVDSTVFDDFNVVVNRRTLQVREIVESVFLDASGAESYRIERQYRDGDEEAWGSVGFDIWYSGYEGNNAYRVEENQRYIKIAFPVLEGKTWAGNFYINVDPDGPLAYLEGWEYEIASIHTGMTIGGISFDSTMTIIQEASGTVIDTIGAHEVYAKGVGLVYKELWVLESQCTACDPDDIPCIIECQQSPWEEKAERGFIVKQTILEYGEI